MEGRGHVSQFHRLRIPRMVQSLVEHLKSETCLCLGRSKQPGELRPCRDGWALDQKERRAQEANPATCAPKSAYVVENSTMGCRVLRVLPGCLVCVQFSRPIVSSSGTVNKTAPKHAVLLHVTVNSPSICDVRPFYQGYANWPACLKAGVGMCGPSQKY